MKSQIPQSQRYNYLHCSAMFILLQSVDHQFFLSCLAVGEPRKGPAGGLPGAQARALSEDRGQLA